MGDMITIQRSDYEMLLKAQATLDAMAAREDAEDMEAVRRFLENPSEGVPDSVFSRILHDENPVLVYREWRGHSVSELARRAGLHRVQVHDIESGKRRGSVMTLKKIADALNVTLDDLVPSAL